MLIKSINFDNSNINFLDLSGCARPVHSLCDDSFGLGDDSYSLGDDSFNLGDDSSGLADDSSGLADDSSGLGDDSSGLGDDSSGLGDDSSSLGDGSSSLGNDSFTAVASSSSMLSSYFLPSSTDVEHLYSTSPGDDDVCPIIYLLYRQRLSVVNK